jgi:hypothetical protein
MSDGPVSIEKFRRLLCLGLRGLEGHDGEITTKGGYRARIVELEDDGDESGPRRVVLAFERLSRRSSGA